MARSPNPEDDGAFRTLFLGRRLQDRHGSAAPLLPLLVPMSQLLRGVAFHTEWHLPCQDALPAPLLRSGIVSVAAPTTSVVVRLIINRASRPAVVGMIGFTHFHIHPLAY